MPVIRNPQTRAKHLIDIMNYVNEIETLLDLDPHQDTEDWIAIEEVLHEIPKNNSSQFLGELVDRAIANNGVSLYMLDRICRYFNNRLLPTIQLDDVDE